jgi:hypothetical protein
MRRSEQGIALAAALLALIVIGALVGGAVLAAQLEHRMGRNTLYAVQAAAAAEAGVSEVLASWEALGLGALVPGESVSLPAVSRPSRTAFAPTVRRLNGELFLVRVVGSRSDAAGAALAERTVGMLARTAETPGPGSPPVAPLASRSWLAGF